MLVAVFKLKCSCGKHKFVFGKVPLKKVEVRCPICGAVKAYDPRAKQPQTKEEINNAGTSE